MAEAIELGAFELRSLLGRGGTAEVWQGIHKLQGIPVAVKVMTDTSDREAAFRDALRHEVQAIAALDHPHIITVYDYGEVSEEAAARSGGRFESGSPYIAMESAPGGTLRALPASTPWPELRRIVLHILDALAHAHARNIIHLDIKPGNVLIAFDRQAQPVYKLADFGIAYIKGQPRHIPASAGDGARTKRMVQGTPPYMAPEQLCFAYRDFGPWTDLYALGCLAWSLVSGAPPFNDPDPRKLANAHFAEEPPPLRPRIDVPKGLEDWLRILLEKKPERRFQRAADAAWALRLLDGGQWPRERRTIEVGGVDQAPPSKAPSSTADASPDARHAGDAHHPPPSDKPLPAGDTSPHSSPDARTSSEDSASPSHRAEAKADAASIAMIENARQNAPEEIPPDADDIESISLSELEPSEGLPTHLSTMEAGASVSHDMGGGMSVMRPPIPTSWSQASVPRRASGIMGAGLALYGLRRVPMAGRMRERDLLWNQLVDVHRSGKASALIVRAAMGMGKSRLTEWMVERADEVGAAIVLRAEHSPSGGADQGLARMMARHFRSRGLDRRATLERVARVLQNHGVTDDYEWHAMTELLHPAPERGGEADGAVVAAADAGDGGEGGRAAAERCVRFGRPDERYALIWRHIGRLSRERPVIVLLDDIQWGADSLSFVEHVMRRRDEEAAPILFLMAAQEEALAEESGVDEQLKALEKLEGVRTIHLEALSYAEHTALVRDLLGLEGALAKEIVARTGGNPLFAVQLVRDWVSRGLLELGRGGFRLKAGARVDLPTDLHQVWSIRVERLLEDLPRDARPCLELAAALGQEVNNDEWEDVCRLAGLTLPSALLESLFAYRLARPTVMAGGGLRVGAWTFVHGMLRESLERMSREAGRWAEQSWLCGTMVLKRYPPDHPGLYERLGHYAIAAGEYRAALVPLLKAAALARRRGDLRAAHRFISEREEAIATLRLPASDPQCAQGWILRAELFNFSGRVNEAMALAERVEQDALRYRWPVLLAEALRMKARVRLESGAPSQAFELLNRALEIYREAGDSAKEVVCLMHLASCEHDRGNMPRSREFGRKALELSEKLRDLVGMADSSLMLGHVCLAMARLREAAAFFQRAVSLYERVGSQAGRAQAIRSLGAVLAQTQPERATKLYQRSLAIFRKLGYVAGEAKCRIDLAELAREAGDLDTAEAGYRAALKLAHALQSGDVVVIRVNLALIFLARGRYDDVRREVTPLIEPTKAAGRKVLLAAIHAVLLPVYASSRDWHAFDAHFRDLCALLDDTAVASADDAYALRVAGDVAAQAGEQARAASAWTRALALWKRLGRRREIFEVEQALFRIDMSA